MATANGHVRAPHARAMAHKLRQRAPWPGGLSISDIPLRREVRRGNPNPAGHILSAKMGRKLQYISPNERAFLLLCEIDPNVIRIADRPIESCVTLNGKDDRHFPDYAVLSGGMVEIHEVKSDEIYFNDQSLISRLSRHARALEDQGAIYSVALRSEIMAEPQYEWAARLWPFSTHRITREAADAVLMTVQSGPIIVADLMSSLSRSLGPNAPSRGSVLGMAARGEIFSDLNGPVGIETVVRPYDPAAMPARLLPIRRPIDDLRDRPEVAS